MPECLNRFRKFEKEVLLPADAFYDSFYKKYGYVHNIREVYTLLKRSYFSAYNKNERTNASPLPYQNNP